MRQRGKRAQGRYTFTELHKLTLVELPCFGDAQEEEEVNQVLDGGCRNREKHPQQMRSEGCRTGNSSLVYQRGMF